jgi:hypothetical protein
MNKATLIENIIKISNMSRSELQAQAVKVSFSGVDDKARYFLNKAIDLCINASKIEVYPIAGNGEYDIEALRG